jgi:hypothetical protein
MAEDLGIDISRLLGSIVGSQTGTDQSRTDRESGTTNQNTTGTSNQAMSGTSSQQQAGTTTQYGSTVGSQSGTTNTSQTTQGVANVADLTALMNQQRAGLTPEALQAIFRQGSEGMPNIINAYSGAVGASTSNNSGVQTALEGMMQKILQTAALSQQAGVNSAAETAGRIAQLTAGSTTSGQSTNLQSSNQTQNQAGTSNQNTSSAQNQNTFGTQSQNVTGSTTRAADINTSTDQSTSVDDSRVMGLLGLLLGGGVLNSGLTRAGLGGIDGVGGSIINAAGGGIADLLRLIGVGGTGGGAQGGNLATQGGGFDLASLLGGGGMTDQQLGDILGALPEFNQYNDFGNPNDFWNFGTSGD